MTNRNVFRHASAALLLSLLCAATASGAAPDAALTRAKRDIQAAYRAEDIGYAERDVNVAFAYHAPDYFSLDRQGRRLNYDQTHESLTALFFAVQTCQAQTTLRHIVMTPEITSAPAGVSAHVLKRIRMTLAPAPGKPKRMVILDQERADLWVRNATGWRLKQSAIVSERKTVNGKPVVRP